MPAARTNHLNRALEPFGEALKEAEFSRNRRGWVNGRGEVDWVVTIERASVETDGVVEFSLETWVEVHPARCEWEAAGLEGPSAVRLLDDRTAAPPFTRWRTLKIGDASSEHATALMASFERDVRPWFASLGTAADAVAYCASAGRGNAPGYPNLLLLGAATALQTGARDTAQAFLKAYKPEWERGSAVVLLRHLCGRLAGRSGDRQFVEITTSFPADLADVVRVLNERRGYNIAKLAGDDAREYTAQFHDKRTGARFTMTLTPGAATETHVHLSLEGATPRFFALQAADELHALGGVEIDVESAWSAAQLRGLPPASSVVVSPPTADLFYRYATARASVQRSMGKGFLAAEIEFRVMPGADRAILVAHVFPQDRGFAWPVASDVLEVSYQKKTVLSRLTFGVYAEIARLVVDGPAAIAALGTLTGVKQVKQIDVCLVAAADALAALKVLERQPRLPTGAVVAPHSCTEMSHSPAAES